MTGAATFGDARATASASVRRIPLAPSEGWTTLGLVVLLCLTLAWSIDDPNWVVGPPDQTDFLAWAIGLGAVWGFVSAKVGWSRWLAHLLGATFGALILSIIVGSVLRHALGGPPEWFAATAASVADAYLDLTARRLPFTDQIGHFLLVLGILSWATGQYAGYVVFHHRRPLNAVLVIGVGLVVSMSLTIKDQLPYLVIYSLAALFLLIRYHAFDERTLWLRHRIGDAAALGGLYLRGGTVFVAAAVIAALFLTSGASSAPLKAMWEGMDQRLIDIGRELQRVFRGAGQGTRLVAVDFGPTAPILGVWTTDGTPVLEITMPTGTSPTERFYWEAVAYDRFDGRSWGWSTSSEKAVPADGELLGGTADDPLQVAARREATFTIRELGLNPLSVFSPETPLSVSVDSTLVAVGGAESRFAALTASARQYSVTAMVPIDGAIDPEHGLTANKLRAASPDYPAGISSLYLQLDPGIVGPATRGLLERILDRHPEATDSPYDMARAITTYLSTSEGGFTYDPDVTDVDCGNSSIVECFAISKVGYCQYYASTMAVLLRVEQIPARLVQGFLPGRRDAAGHETVRMSDSHAWVEVYFPGYGWVQFDPTGGGIGQDQPLPQGPQVPRASATPRPSLPGDEGQDPRRSLSASPAPVGAPGSTTGPGSGPFILVGILLALAMGGLAFVAWQRGPRSPGEPDSVYRSVVSLARRLGFAPQPSQTVFEYTDSLGEVLPKARPDLHTVARAKVEVAYGRRFLDEDRLRSLREAQRRLRVALLGLVFRRRQRPGRRR